MQLSKFKGYLYFILQMIFLVSFLFAGLVKPTSFYYGLFESLGILLGIWAINVMTRKNLSLLPFVKPHASLIVAGPYKYIRHPMYSAIILAFLPVLINHFNIVRCIIFILLLFTLLIKLRFEESLLEKKFEGYNSYKANTSRIIPFIF